MAEYFESLNGFFDHIYVITLRRAEDRQRQIRGLLEGLNYEFFYGADKAEFSIPEIKERGIYDEEKARRLHRYGKPLMAGQIGCSWSHLRVYEDMAQKGYSNALILEDDVVPKIAELPLFSTIISELPPDWELLYLDHNRHSEQGTTTRIKQLYYHLLRIFGAVKWSHATIRNLYARPYSKHLRRAGYHDYTNAYALTLPGAKKLAALQTPIAYLADNLLAHACSNQVVNGYICLPELFSQESQDADGAGSFVTD